MKGHTITFSEYYSEQERLGNENVVSGTMSLASDVGSYASMT